MLMLSLELISQSTLSQRWSRYPAELLHVRSVFGAGVKTLNVDLLLLLVEVGLFIEHESLVLDDAKEDLLRL